MSSSSTRTPGTSGRSELLDLTECPICCVRFERPLQLNCGHSFCTTCVDRLIAEARDNRNDNFLEGIRRFAFPMRQDPNFHLLNRFEDDLWPHLPPRPPPPPPPPLMYPGLGGVPRPMRNYRNHEDMGDVPFNRGGAPYNDVTIKCPECRQTTKVPPEGLPVNYRLQELVTHVAQTPEVNNASCNDAVGSGFPKCLVCDEVMAKGVYLTCRSCATDNETARQLCSMCCLRNHNGHDIEEKRFLTMQDVVVGRDSVSEATGRGYQAVDQALQSLDGCTASAKVSFQEVPQLSILVIREQIVLLKAYEKSAPFHPRLVSEHVISVVRLMIVRRLRKNHKHLQKSTRNVLRAFELIAGDMQIETLTSHDELERRVQMAQEICAKLEQLPDVLKGVLEKFRAEFDAAMNHFVSSTMVYEGTALNPFAAEVLGAGQGGSSGGDGNASEAAPVLTPNSSGLTEDVRDVPRTLSMLERRTRQLRAMQQQCSALRRRRLHERSRDTHGTRNSFRNDRERLERLREELRSDLYETDRDLESRERLGRAERSVQPPLPTGAQTSSSSTSLAVPSRPNRREERRRSNSIEIISPSPPAVADLEQRAGRLIITPERRHPKSEEQDEEHSPNSSAVCTRITGKHRRGLDLLKTGDNSSSNTDDSEPTTSKGCTASRTRPSKRKIGVTIIRFPTHPSEPGPSYVSETHEEPMVGDTVENQAEEAGDSNEADNIKVFSEHMY